MRKGITQAPIRELIFIILAVAAIFAIIFIVLYYYGKIPIELIKK